MAEEKRFVMATRRIMEALLETDNLEEALSGSLEIIVDELGGEAGAGDSRLLSVFGRFCGTFD